MPGLVDGGDPLAWSSRPTLHIRAYPPAPPHFPLSHAGEIDPDEALLIVLTLLSFCSFFATCIPRSCMFCGTHLRAQRNEELLQPKGSSQIGCCTRLCKVLRRMAVAIIGRPDVKPLEERTELLEQELMSTILQHRWKQAQMHAQLEQKEHSAAEMLHTVQKLKGVAVGMRGSVDQKTNALEELEREVIDQAVKMQQERDEALEAARFAAEQILEQREKELRDETEALLESERRRKQLDIDEERHRLEEEKEARLQSFRQRAEEERRQYEQRALAALRKADARIKSVEQQRERELQGKEEETQAQRRATQVATSKHAALEMQLQTLESEAKTQLAERAKLRQSHVQQVETLQREKQAQAALLEAEWRTKLERANEERERLEAEWRNASEQLQSVSQERESAAAAVHAVDSQAQAKLAALREQKEAEERRAQEAADLAARLQRERDEAVVQMEQLMQEREGLLASIEETSLEKMKAEAQLLERGVDRASVPPPPPPPDRTSPRH